MYWAVEDYRQNPYEFKLKVDLQQDDFFESKRNYWAISLNGGHANKYILPSIDPSENTPYYFSAVLGLKDVKI